MSAARTARLLSPAPTPAVPTVEQQARRVVKGLRRSADRLGGHLDNMVRIQMGSYPSDWSEADRREMAEWHLFGRAGA